MEIWDPKPRGALWGHTGPVTVLLYVPHYLYINPYVVLPITDT